jgi:hypothetical protein
MQNKDFKMRKETLTKKQFLSSFTRAPFFQFTRYNERALMKAPIFSYANELEYIAIYYNLPLHRTPSGFMSMNKGMETAMRILIHSVNCN